MGPAEVLASESQERMCAVVAPGAGGRLPRRLRASGTCWPPCSARSPRPAGWRSTGTASGRGRAAARPSRTRARSTTGPIARPADQDALVADDPAALPRPRTGPSCARCCCAWSPRPACAAKTWVTDQYDRYVSGNTVLAQPEDAGVVRIDEATGRGVALATDGNGRYTRLDPYAGAQLALAEAYRNVAATGAEPIAVTNCLNFGSPEDPGVMWQFSRGRARPGRRLPAARHPGDRRQRQLLQPDRRDADPADARSSGVLGVLDDVTAGVRRMGFAEPGRRGRAARRDRRAVRRLGVGVRRARAPRRHAAAGRPGRRAGAGRGAARPRGRCAARTTCPTAAWPRRWSSAACAGTWARRSRSTATRSSRCSASRRPGPW